MEATSKHVLTPDMQLFLELVSEGKNVFLTGKAGTGKSTLLQHLCDTIISENHAILAPTGVAAINIGGSTIHKFFGFLPDVTLEIIESQEYLPKNRSVMKLLKTLVIDEISMVRADLMDCIDLALRKFGPIQNEPFGGVQMLFVGDLHQLQPIVTRSEREFIDTNFESPFFYSSAAFSTLEWSFIELKEVFRQKDAEFVEILNAARINRMEERHFQRLAKSVDPTFIPQSEEDYITLVATNNLAQRINDRELEALQSPLHSSKAIVFGPFSKGDFPADVDLRVKVDSKIMMLNNDLWGRWVNGTLAKITGMKQSENKEVCEISVLLEETGETYTVTRHTWEVTRPRSENGKLVHDTVGSFTQFPLMLAWAITIHKSQGKSFERVIIDLSAPVFANGQLYVALSRCRSLESTILRQQIAPRQILVDERVSEFYSKVA